MKRLKLLTIPLVMLLAVVFASVCGITVFGAIKANSGQPYTGVFDGYSKNLSTQAWNNWQNDKRNANKNAVMSSNPQITVLTHGLAGNASNFSNRGKNSPKFASDEQSIISKLGHFAGGAQVFLA